MPGADTFHASAAAYDRLVGRYGPSLAAGLLAFAGVEPGMRALDVGCGPGRADRRPRRAAGARRGPRGGAVRALRGACRARVPGAEVVVAPAERLPFAAATFDVTLAQLVVNFLADPPAGVREMARVTRPGGVVAGCVWDYAVA